MPKGSFSARYPGRSPQDLRRLVLRFEADARRAEHDPHAAPAENAYESIRSRIVTLFECHHCSQPEELADDVFDRVAVKLETQEIDDVRSYCFGVAWNVLKEARKVKSPEAPFEGGVNVGYHGGSEDEKAKDEKRMACLERCLEGLERPDRELILEYYQGDGSERISVRKTLASKLSISETHLRVSALRIRKQLEKCVKACLDSQKEAGAGS